MTATSPWMTVDEAAAYLRVSDKTVYRACASKSLPLRHYRVGGRRSLRFKREDLDAWMEQQRTPVEAL